MCKTRGQTPTCSFHYFLILHFRVHRSQPSHRGLRRELLSPHLERRGHIGGAPGDVYKALIHLHMYKRESFSNETKHALRNVTPPCPARPTTLHATHPRRVPTQRGPAAAALGCTRERPASRRLARAHVVAGVSSLDSSTPTYGPCAVGHALMPAPHSVRHRAPWSSPQSTTARGGARSPCPWPASRSSQARSRRSACRGRTLRAPRRRSCRQRAR